MKPIVIIAIALVSVFLIIENFETVYGVISYPTITHRLENLPTYCIVSPSGLTATERGNLIQIATSGVSKWNDKLQNYEKINPELWAINSRVISSEGSTAGCDITINFIEKSDRKSDTPGFTVLGTFYSGTNSIDVAFRNIDLGRIFNILIHEIGHSIGLGHYVSDDNELNEKWYSGKVFSPSIMIPTTNRDTSKMDIMDTDILKVRSMYGADGFYAFSTIPAPGIPTPSPIPIPRPEPIIPIKPIDSIQITEQNILVSKYDSKIVKITGQIKEDIFLKGIPVYVTIKSSDGFVAHKLTPTKTGLFELPMVFDEKSQKGWFEVEASYLEHTDTDMNFYFFVGKPIINYSETIIPEVEEKPPANAISGKFLENISVESKNNNYTITAYFSKNYDSLSSTRITVDNECPKKKEIIKKDFQFIPGQKKTFSFYQLPDGKPSECSLYFTLSNFEGKTIEEIIINYDVESDDKKDKQIISNVPKTTLTPQIPSTTVIPSWIQNNAKWWSEGNIDDDSFTLGLEFLIKEKIINVEPVDVKSFTPKEIPAWVKNNAGWWGQGLISENDFLQSTEWLIENGLIRIEQ